STVTPTTQFYPLSLHDALPISASRLNIAMENAAAAATARMSEEQLVVHEPAGGTHVIPITGRISLGRAATNDLSYPEDSGLSRQDRKSTRLNSSHLVISYAVFC